jgi:hypothetical protein
MRNLKQKQLSIFYVSICFGKILFVCCPPPPLNLQGMVKIKFLNLLRKGKIKQ